MNGPTGTRQVLRCPSPAHFHDRNPVPLLHQPVSGNAAAKTRADHDEIEIPFAGLRHHRGSSAAGINASLFVVGFAQQQIISPAVSLVFTRAVDSLALVPNLTEHAFPKRESHLTGSLVTATWVMVTP